MLVYPSKGKGVWIGHVGPSINIKDSKFCWCYMVFVIQYTFFKDQLGIKNHMFVLPVVWTGYNMIVHNNDSQELTISVRNVIQ